MKTKTNITDTKQIKKIKKTEFFSKKKNQGNKTLYNTCEVSRLRVAQHQHARLFVEPIPNFRLLWHHIAAKKARIRGPKIAVHFQALRRIVANCAFGHRKPATRTACNAVFALAEKLLFGTGD
jgi:hypothetical protein